MVDERPLAITDVRFSAASYGDDGLLGWVSATLDGVLRLDGIMLRETRGGRRTLSFPSRVDRQGRKHSLVRPLDDAARRAIERQVFEALDLPESSQ